MFLIPFICRKNDDFYRFYIFLDKGTQFIELDIQDIDEFCNENGLYYDKKIVIEDYCYLFISNKTNLLSFYTYTENCEAECWRRFITFEKDLLHINSTNPEFIQPILKTVEGWF